MSIGMIFPIVFFVIVCLAAIFEIVRFAKQKENELTEKYYDNERFVQREVLDLLGWPIRKEAVIEKLKLSVEFVFSNTDVKAVLVAPKSADENGRILINSRFSENVTYSGFVREVVRYIVDIGIGNKVPEHFIFDQIDSWHADNTELLNYYASVALVPARKLFDDVNGFDGQWHKTNDSVFFGNLSDKYCCDKEFIKIRIGVLYLFVKKSLIESLR